MAMSRHNQQEKETLIRNEVDAKCGMFSLIASCDSVSTEDHTVIMESVDRVVNNFYSPLRVAISERQEIERLAKDADAEHEEKLRRIRES